MKLFLKKTGKAFWPCDTMGEDFMANAQDGYWECKKVSERSYRQLSMAQKMIDITFQNQEQFKSREALRDALSIEAGHTELRERLNGERMSKQPDIWETELGQTVTRCQQIAEQYRTRPRPFDTNRDWMRLLSDFCWALDVVPSFEMRKKAEAISKAVSHE